MSTQTETAVATQVFRVYIKASPEAIWDAITKPEWTERYGYRGRTEFDLRPGGSFKAFATEAMRSMGLPDVVVDGEVVDADPPRRLVQTWRALWSEDIAAESPTRVTFDIEEDDGGVTRLDRDPRARRRTDPRVRGRHVGCADVRGRWRLAHDPQRPEDPARDRQLVQV